MAGFGGGWKRTRPLDSTALTASRPTLNMVIESAPPHVAGLLVRDTIASKIMEDKLGRPAEWVGCAVSRAVAQLEGHS